MKGESPVFLFPLRSVPSVLWRSVPNNFAPEGGDGLWPLLQTQTGDLSEKSVCYRAPEVQVKVFTDCPQQVY